MGLFSNLRKATNGVDTAEATAKAVLSMPLMVAAADGQIDDAEIHQILNMCAFSPIFHAVGAERTHKLAEEAVAVLKTKGAEALFTDVKDALSPNMVETAMCFAIRTSLADGRLDESEKTMLIAMGQRLGLPQDTFVKIFEVMMMLQRPAT
ncbi:MAG: tellurite resistance TerB family protein [Pseudomonadota bacterium]